MSDGIQIQETPEIPQKIEEVAEVKQQLDRATIEPEAAIEEGDIQQAEDLQQAFSDTVQLAPAAEKPPEISPGSEGVAPSAPATEPGSSMRPTDSEDLDSPMSSASRGNFSAAQTHSQKISSTVAAGESESISIPANSEDTSVLPKTEDQAVEETVDTRTTEAIAQIAENVEQDDLDAANDQLKAAIDLLQEAVERQSDMADNVISPSAPPGETDAAGESEGISVTANGEEISVSPEAKDNVFAPDVVYVPSTQTPYVQAYESSPLSGAEGVAKKGETAQKVPVGESSDGTPADQSDAEPDTVISSEGASNPVSGVTGVSAPRSDGQDFDAAMEGAQSGELNGFDNPDDDPAYVLRTDDSITPQELADRVFDEESHDLDNEEIAQAIEQIGERNTTDGDPGSDQTPASSSRTSADVLEKMEIEETVRDESESSGEMSEGSKKALGTASPSGMGGLDLDDEDSTESSTDTDAAGRQTITEGAVQVEILQDAAAYIEEANSAANKFAAEITESINLPPATNEQNAKSALAETDLKQSGGTGEDSSDTTLNILKVESAEITETVIGPGTGLIDFSGITGNQEAITDDGSPSAGTDQTDSQSEKTSEKNTDSSATEASNQEDISSLKDELSDWPEGETREITVTTWEEGEDGTLVKVEKTITLTKEEAEALLEEIGGETEGTEGRFRYNIEEGTLLVDEPTVDELAPDASELREHLGIKTEAELARIQEIDQQIEELRRLISNYSEISSLCAGQASALEDFDIGEAAGAKVATYFPGIWFAYEPWTETDLGPLAFKLTMSFPVRHPDGTYFMIPQDKPVTETTYKSYIKTFETYSLSMTELSEHSWEQILVLEAEKDGIETKYSNAGETFMDSLDESAEGSADHSGDSNQSDTLPVELEQKDN